MGKTQVRPASGIGGSTYQVRAGDTVTMDPFSLYKRDGTGVDLTGAGAHVRFQLDRFDDGVNVLDTTAVVVSGTAPAQVSYTFAPTDLTKGMLYRARWLTFYGTSGPQEIIPSAPDDFLLQAY